MTFHARLPLALVLLAAGAALAQPVYRHVDAQGRVSFSDRPPAADARPAAAGTGAAAAPAANTDLPYELRQVAQRYPVTLYSGEDCAPCATGRSLLRMRGIPFDERTVTTPADIEALQRLSSQNALPLLTIGSQQLPGFSDAQWSQYLDAAGYPKSVQLPAGYRPAPAQPLVAQQPAVPAPAPVQRISAPPAAPPPLPDGPTPANPAGIRF